MGRFRPVCWRPGPRRFQPCRRRIRAAVPAVPWFLEWASVPPSLHSQVRQNYGPECEAAVNSHAALEFHASFQCLAVASYLDHDDVALKHCSRFFLLLSHEHSKTAASLILLQNRRVGRVCFLDIRKPETQKWESGLQAMQDTLQPGELAIESCDTDLYLFVGIGYLAQQVKFIKDLEDLVSKLSNMRSLEGALAEYFFDKLTLGVSDKKD
ncbi:ferritin heavy polypeptide-like 17 [Odocoileus virginianus]|uniref:Ferritin n=1 Tax=Odocoileus virginianus TaxID=9874 RepID=A0ABM4HQT5_ODOVR